MAATKCRTLNCGEIKVLLHGPTRLASGPTQRAATGNVDQDSAPTDILNECEQDEVMTIGPRVFISYSHDSPEHLDRTLALSARLRMAGVDCRIDQYEESPEEGWPLWCEEQVEQSSFVLVACTETYLRRFKKKELPQVGLGGTWEGHIITQELYNAQGRNTKFIPILFSQEDDPSVPLALQG